MTDVGANVSTETVQTDPSSKRLKTDEVTEDKTEKPDGIGKDISEVELPPCYFLFGETTKGPLMETAGPLWKEVHTIIDATENLFDDADPPRHVTVYKTEPLIYR